MDLSGVSGGAALEPHIVAGGAHTCSATTGGGLKCWGSNTHGQLGDGSTTDSADPLDGSRVEQWYQKHGFGRKLHLCDHLLGTPEVLGENTHGQLGDGSHTDSPLPLTVNLSGVSVQQAAAGAGHTCVLTQAGSVQCWGDNSYGQLGDGTTTESSTPVTVTLGSSAVWDCGRRIDQLRSAERRRGQMLGAGRRRTVGRCVVRFRPFPLQCGGRAGGSGRCADRDHTGGAGVELRLRPAAGGLVDCWGKNDWGQVGQGSTTPGLWTYATPVLTELGGSPLQGAKQITAGGAHACVRMYTNRLKCWGQGEVGQLGEGSSGSGVYSALPLTVIDHYQPYGGSIPYLEVVSQVSAGSAHTCAS